MVVLVLVVLVVVVVIVMVTMVEGSHGRSMACARARVCVSVCYAGEMESPRHRVTMTGHADEARMDDDRETKTRGRVAK